MVWTGAPALLSAVVAAFAEMFGKFIRIRVTFAVHGYNNIKDMYTSSSYKEFVTDII